MKLNIHPVVIFRTPKFSCQANLMASWDELKQDIAISSDTFYQAIKDIKAEELAGLPPKIYFTIWKYFNRAKYRSTPYGTFASFGLLKDAIKPYPETIRINELQQVHRFIDWPYKNNIQFNIQDLLFKNCLLFSNTSYYNAANSIRYIACTEGVFELAEIDDDPFVKQILEACLKPVKTNDLISNLQLDDAGKVSLFTLLEDMHALQLIFTDYDPNIIGEDYFERINIIPQNNLPEYLIAQREVSSGHIDESLLQHVPELVQFLHKVVPQVEKESLTGFINRFKKKFEKKEVPLLLALDPEMGVGYDELEQAGDQDDFVTRFKHNTDHQKTEIELKSVLRNELIAESFEKGKTLFLNKSLFKLNENSRPIPNSFSLMMNICDGVVHVDQIGGVTANALSGRFTLAGKDVLENSIEIARIEQNANPEVLFFDVAYTVEANVDNINRRKLIYNHQLSILNFDTSHDPLSLRDIMISVNGDEIILRSEKLGKRIVPKMASAYNYTRSDLSVFRLLCDLQHHGIQTNLNICLKALFPGLAYYPRLQYKNIVLNEAKWQIKKENLFKANNDQPSVQQCRAYLQEIGLSPYFKTGLSDQTLCFNLNSDEDLSMFMQYLQKHKEVSLEEVCLPEESLIKDQKLQPYFGQFIVGLYHTEKVYREVTNTKRRENNAVKQIFLPGREWLYFEIYCHQQRADQILTGPIASFLNTHEENIRQWFFVRYHENGDHLRFRVLLNNIDDGYKLTAALSNDLEQDLLAGLVSDVQIKTYKRETARYGNDLIEKAEEHFYRDSQFVLSIIESQFSNFNKYSLCAALAHQIQKAELFDIAFLEVIKIMSNSFNEEHHLEPADFKKLNNQYQLYRKENVPDLNEVQISNFKLFVASFIDILQVCPAERRIRLFSDLMHMHVNRLFIKDQRSHEMVMYYFLLKELQRKNATAKLR
ncbi:lantibiotic dehydratase [Pedobacter punctiformis]|uniref:Thiopeptide-type bacteriocin biosynthesis protein n=1 Tax=Pedobacter punctiformis TaxID=3004097 RepID=A0ABT4LBD4_9SPHI|nr:lantibiotic dehydratase [Pedobacter sp. HCMS5-2]MCZ4245233.1 thiopeptide-type bacteriocin biosynthesis protein [Pedobacter sp. HCMS5-2]